MTKHISCYFGSSQRQHGTQFFAKNLAQAKPKMLKNKKVSLQRLKTTKLITPKKLAMSKSKQAHNA